MDIPAVRAKFRCWNQSNSNTKNLLVVLFQLPCTASNDCLKVCILVTSTPAWPTQVPDMYRMFQRTSSLTMRQVGRPVQLVDVASLFLKEPVCCNIKSITSTQGLCQGLLVKNQLYFFPSFCLTQSSVTHTISMNDSTIVIKYTCRVCLLELCEPASQSEPCYTLPHFRQLRPGVMWAAQKQHHRRLIRGD